MFIIIQILHGKTFKHFGLRSTLVIVTFFRNADWTGKDNWEKVAGPLRKRLEAIPLHAILVFTLNATHMMYYLCVVFDYTP